MHKQPNTHQTEHFADSSAPAKSTSKNKWRWLRRTCCLLLALLLLLLLFLFTAKGQQTAFRLVDRWLEPLTIGKVEGSIQQGLTLSDTQFVMEGVNVNVGQATLHIGFECLIYRRACVENIALKDAHVTIDSTKLPPSKKVESKPFTELNIPLEIELKKLSLDNIHVKIDDMDIQLDSFSSGITGKGRVLNLSPTQLTGLQLSLAPVAQLDQQAVEKADDLAKNSVNQPAHSIDWSAIKQQLISPLLSKQSPISLPLDVIIPQFEGKNILIQQKVRDQAGEVNNVKSLVHIDSLQLRANVDQQAIRLEDFSLVSDQGHLLSKGSLILANDYPLNLHVMANLAEQKSINLPASELTTTLSGSLLATTHLTMQTSGVANMKLVSDVQLAEPKTPLKVSLNSDAIHYPLLINTFEQPLKIQAADIQLNGDLLDYQLDTQISVAGMGMQKSQLALKGQGQITQFNIEELRLDALEGNAKLGGNVDWSDGVEWNADLRLAGVNTQTLLPNWPANLSGMLQSKGYAARGAENDWQLDFPQLDIKGQLFNKDLHLQGDLKSSSQTLLDIANASLIYGDNNIVMKGQLGKQSDFFADINAPNLQGLIPKLLANINGYVKLTGDISAPNLDLDLDAKKLSYNDIQLKHLTAKGQLTTEKMVQGKLILGMDQFVYDKINIKQADLIVEGNEGQHSLRLVAKGQPVGADLKLKGKFDRAHQVWTGQIDQLAFDSKEFGTLKTQEAVKLNYDHQKINATIAAHCWRNRQFQLCFPRSFNAGVEGQLPFELKQFDLAILQPLLAKQSQLAGIVNAKGEVAWGKHKLPQLNVQLDSHLLQFTQKLEEGKTLPLILSPVSINVNLADDNLKLQTAMGTQDNGNLKADLSMLDIAANRKLSGNIDINQLSLKLIQPLLNAGEKVDGKINGHLSLAGNVSSPLLNGSLNLSALQAKANAMPFNVTAGQLDLAFHGATSTLTGKIRTVDSELELTGNADWRHLDAWRTQLQAKAHRFRLDMPNLAKVEFSPDIEVVATPKSLNLSGQIDIPSARIQVEKLPESAVSVSNDEIIMGQSVKKIGRLAKQPVPQQTENGTLINANININIGNDVYLNAYGLKSYLGGTIAVRQGKQGLGLYGQVHMKKGCYASFGQDLLIRRGVINFAGLPSQPTLNIEAIRNPDAMDDPDIVAGVKINGLADAPEVKVFSEPALSQNEALSYILTGRSLENSGDSAKGNAMAMALLNLSLAKSSKTVGKIGSAFGLNDLTVTTAGIGDKTKVEVSASLTPKFRVKYSIGIFAALTELTLRYNLTPKLYLQWVSSVNQAVDLMYRFEFD
ncbi:tubulin-binding protein [[Haemophilus] ducreyi]|uniref:autotransporter assembly complex protein TamB n=1 Tax=Haemophilus ducreyi TaxID=730 RepID=UPI0007CDC9ED|nr:translocation/assembly module TamB domain-containing protein [[Haemophilus] ducreyi]ANF73683.1 tubulin-binding protein [[Haemophilus] ducreyi]ANF75480.1 tubulin-binding protein [[Haemophilus] ducreyi]